MGLEVRRHFWGGNTDLGFLLITHFTVILFCLVVPTPSYLLRLETLISLRGPWMGVIGFLNLPEIACTILGMSE